MAVARFRSSDTVDFVVIGSGAAGGVVAKELATAGFRVVVLEQGPYLREKDFTHDEIKFLRQGFLMNDWKRQPNTFRKTEAETAVEQPAVLLTSRLFSSRKDFSQAALAINCLRVA